MPADVELARREGIELVKTGNWSAMSGAWNPTPEDLAAAVEAQDCPAVRKPVLKLGHQDPRFDGEPALGWFENLRVADGGHTLLADQVALPWLHSVQAAAYPSRSVEGNYNHACGAGHRHKFVLTAVALLGVTPPAVKTIRNLNDLPAMLGVAAGEPEVPDGAERVQVTILAGGFDEGNVKRDGDGKFARKSGGSNNDAAGTTGNPAVGDDALAVPPLNLADMDRNDPRAQALWFRTGDNSMETGDYPGFVQLNEHMRKGGWNARLDGYVADIDAAMAESKLPAPIRVFRGIEASAIGEPGRLEGVEFTDKAFASTTTDEKHARAFGSIMTITVPDGVAAIRMADRDPDLVESEILLDRNLRYRVVREVLEIGADRIPTRHDIEVEVIPVDQVQAATAKPTGGEPSVEDVQRAKYVWAPGDIEIVTPIGKAVSAAAEVHTGAMVALIPTAADAGRLAVDGGEPTDQLHVTLCYLGPADQIPDRARARLLESVARAVASLPSFDADAFSIAAFNPGRTDRDPCVTLGISGDLVESAHDLATMAVAEVAADMTLDVPAPHRPFHAHLTLGYTGDLAKVAAWADRVGYTGDLAKVAAWADRVGPIRFDRIRVAFGGATTDIPLTAADWGSLPVAAATIPPDQPAPVLPAAEPEQPPSDPKEEDPVSDTDLSGFRSRLGLTDDAGQDQILEAIDALKAKADTPAPAPADPNPELVAASAAAAERTAELEKTVEKLGEQLGAISAELAAAKQEKADTVKASVLGEAKRLGKFKPADEQRWSDDYDEAPGVTTRILASIAPGTAVPVQASGTTGPAEPDLHDDGLGVSDSALDAWAKQLGISSEELTHG